MSGYEISKTTVNGFTVTIGYELDAQSPHDDCARGADMVLSLEGYDLPDDAGVDTSSEGMNLQELTEYLYLPFAVIDEDDGGVLRRFATEQQAAEFIGTKPLPENKDGYGIDSDGHQPALLVLPVYGYIHSVVALRAGDRPGQFADPWDSGVAGVAYVTPKIWEYLSATPWTGSEEDIARATQAIASHVSDYGHYLNGDVYCYLVEDWDGEYIDSRGGFYDFDECEQAAAEAANDSEHERKCTGTLERTSGTIAHEGDCPVHGPGDGNSPRTGFAYTE